jgi:protein-disulfide isomerase
MATQHRPTARSRGRTVQQPKRRRGVFLVSVIALLFLGMIGSVAMLGRADSGAANSDVRIATNDVPPNAEPNGRAWGPKDAPITVVEYADYECESCGFFATNYEREFVETFADTGKVRFEIRYAPFHGEGAKNAAQAASCAADQNMFWPMHDSLFLNQPQHGAPVSAGFSVERLTAIAERLKLDVPAFNQCLTSGKYRQEVEDALVETQRMNVTGTPTFFVNDTPYTGPMPASQFRQIFAEVAPDVAFD